MTSSQSTHHGARYRPLARTVAWRVTRGIFGILRGSRYFRNDASPRGGRGAGWLWPLGFASDAAIDAPLDAPPGSIAFV
jgi:hypothetical protein